ncbi:MAG: hypothetical protein PHD29_04270 [bacterium]|nr:hypothetical protein [bacterium]MDD5354030.1 hypothetical protein [bacterium]MDD5755979.1 hypothetical protein [bacterium]
MLKNQQGAAIVSVMVVIIFVTGIVIGLMFWLWSEAKRSNQVKSQAKAMYLAEAGTQKALYRLKNDATYNVFLDSITVANDTDVFTLVFPDSSTVKVTLQEKN